MDNLKKEFNLIYDTYIEKIYRFVFIKVSSQEIAEDLTSEAFIKAWQVFSKDSKKIENQSAFLYKIARNLVIDYYRKKSRFQYISSDYSQIIDPRSSNLEEMAATGSDFDRVAKALGDINDSYREVIVLHYLDDLKTPEIAKIINKSDGTVRVLLHRALNALRENLNEETKQDLGAVAIPLGKDSA